MHGGLLAIRGNARHEAQSAEHGIAPIDLLVVNLYPFEATVAKGAGFEDCIENIDIGGPALIRGAAKNHAGVTVVVDPADYERVLAEMRQHDGATTLERAQGACRQGVRAHGSLRRGDQPLVRGDAWARRCPRGERSAVSSSCRCATAKIRTSAPPSTAPAIARPGVATAVQHQGKELSYNNLNDTDAALELVAELGTDKPAVAIIKHANPCGAAVGATLKDAYLKALRCDSVSAFGGIIALNGTIDAAAAEEITKIFTEVVIAPDATDEAKAIFAAKKNLRLLTTGGLPDPTCGRRRGALARWRLARAVARQRCGHGSPISRLSASASRPSAN